MVTGLLTALVWVCSLLSAPIANGETQREIERAFAHAAPSVAAIAPTLRAPHGGAARHGAFHSFGPADAQSSSQDAQSAQRAASPVSRERQVTPERYRIAPHDATAPPASAIIA